MRAPLVTRMPVVLATVAVAVLACTSALYAVSSRHARWTPAERELLRSLSLASLGPLPSDPSNRFADDTGAARLGHALFFDTRLSKTGTVSCASCHVPDAGFQDGKPLGEGVGIGTRRTMPVAGTAYSPWLFWDGRTDSQWAQALGPLENPVEHGGNRTQYAHLVAAEYRKEYESVFGALPALRQEEITRVYVNIGKAIAAYERRIGFAPSRFDRYVDAEIGGREHTPASMLTPDEEAGLRLFIGKGSCTNCHNGALLTDNHFHNTGVPSPATPLPPDSGRASGAPRAVAGEFACTSRYSDAKPEECSELRFAVTEGPELVRAYKPPSLRNVAERAPYMHAGQIATLADVVRHYSDAPAAPFGHSELKPLHLSAAEQRQLVAFLATLSGPLAAPPGYLAAPTRRP